MVEPVTWVKVEGRTERASSRADVMVRDIIVCLKSGIF